MVTSPAFSCASASARLLARVRAALASSSCDSQRCKHEKAILPHLLNLPSELVLGGTGQARCRLRRSGGGGAAEIIVGVVSMASYTVAVEVLGLVGGEVLKGPAGACTIADWDGRVSSKARRRGGGEVFGRAGGNSLSVQLYLVAIQSIVGWRRISRRRGLGAGGRRRAGLVTMLLGGEVGLGLYLGEGIIGQAVEVVVPAVLVLVVSHAIDERGGGWQA